MASLTILDALAAATDVPHLMINGGNGASLAAARDFARRVFGKTPSIASNRAVGDVSVRVVSAPHWMEVSPCDAGSMDRIVIQQLVKEVASSQPLDTSHRRFRLLIIADADRLTRDAQHGLRRTMERFCSACRIILACERPDAIVAPLRSRCVCVRVPAAPAVRSLVPVNAVLMHLLADPSPKSLRACRPLLSSMYVDGTRVADALKAFVLAYAARPEAYDDAVIACVHHAAAYEATSVGTERDVYYLEAFVARAMADAQRRRAAKRKMQGVCM